MDLEINITDGLDYSTHRKELAQYAYTPYDSCHSASTLNGIVCTELVRLLRTNLHENTFNHQVNFFFGKLLLRGYDIVKCRQLATKYPWSRKSLILKKKARVGEGRTLLVPFKLPYSPAVPDLHMSHIFKTHSHVLPDDLKSVLKPMLALQTSANLFRQRYFRFR